MKTDIKTIRQPIDHEMTEFEEKFKDYMKSKIWLVNKIMTYIVDRKGKQMRPMFVFLTAGTCGQISEATYRGAALIELLHTATLLHDDVVDDSNYRRSFFSVNAIWKNKIAVLAGDYLLSKGLLLSIDHDDFALLKIVSKAVREMSEGEILQLEKARTLDITEEIYFEVIRMKTATLIEACCAVGASSVGANPDYVSKMAVFGEKIGIAFQIKDDLFDYGEVEIGKPRGIDIKEKKMTLPLIHALNKSDKTSKNKIINLIKNESDNPKKVAEVIDFVKKSDGLNYAIKKMEEFIVEADTILATFPESSFKTSLQQLVRYTIERSR
ncbi:MAG: polyprenyl synthetase family protein [Bacteroidetes bacterium]|nr:MAG: polyprenyl synthetase family protein [Bacteroidota bacterium]